MVQKHNIPTVQLLLMECQNGSQSASMDLFRYERELTIDKCVKSIDKSIYTLTQNKETEESILRNIFLLTQRFLMANFPESAIDVIAMQFSQDIVELRRDWNLDDIVMFFKFIRQRQDIPELKTYGGKITAIKLIEFSNYYENERCEVKEQFLLNQKTSKNIKSEKDDTVNKLFATFGKELQEKQNLAIEKERKEKIERAVKNNTYHKENEFCIEWLKINKVPEMIAVKWYNNFLIRK